MSLTDEQKAIRHTGIGSSEIGAVVGLSPYANAFDVFRAKVEGLELKETLPMKRGRILEPAVAQWYAEETGAQLRECGTVRHPTCPIALATPDRIATLKTGERVLEIKTAGIHLAGKWGEPGTDEVPECYLVQCAWEMACANLPEADLAVLIAGDDFRVYHLRRDLELESLLLEQAEKFWREHVVKRIPPAIDGSESCSDWLASRWPHHEDQTLAADPETESWARELLAAKKLSKAAEEKEKLAKNHLQARMGTARKLLGDGWSATWSEVSAREQTDWAAVAGALAAQFRLPDAEWQRIQTEFTDKRGGHRRFCIRTQEEK
jgi:putative phage-type endonuclease